jgi:hypothetical protein
MGPAARMNPGHPSIPDAKLLPKELDLLPEPIILSGQSDPGVDAVGRPAAGGYDGVVSQGDDVEDGRLDAPGSS